MKQSLELKLGQRLTMTPQLQQAIKLLQLSGAELQAEVHQALESNPLLEEREADDETPGASSTLSESTDQTMTRTSEGEGADVDIQMTNDSVTQELSSDVEWEERFERPIAGSVRNNDIGAEFDIDARNSRPPTLRDHLDWQMRMTPFSPTDRRIAQSIIGSINQDGYLTCSLQELQEMLTDETEADIDEIEAVLHRIQNFDPNGVGARNLSECLLIQLRDNGSGSSLVEHARRLVSEHLQLLANRDYAQLRRALGLTSIQLQQVIDLIHELYPRPGNTIEPAQPTYIIPDIIVKNIRNRWSADLNWEVFPELRINRAYRALIRRGDESGENKFLQDQLQEARWFIKSIQNRNETLLKVARAIVERQKDFFEYGEEAMKPLVLHDIAAEMEMHESTVSRATTQKYMLTPRGIFELKYFFSSGVSTSDGGSCSATAIKSHIKKLVESELPTKPISDSRMVKILAEQGIKVARRTVAKYRDHLNIPPSNQRKELS